MYNMQRIPFTDHQFYINEDYRIYSYYDTNKDRIYKHCHDFYELYVLISGRIKYSTAGNSFFLAPGDFLFINRLQEHFPEVLDFSVPYERMALHVSPAVLEELSCDNVNLASIFSANEFKVYHYPPALHAQITTHLNTLFELYQSPHTYGSRILGRSTLAALFVLFNKYIDTPSIYSFGKQNKNIQIISIAESYVRNHLSEKITVEDLANHLFFNKYYFMHQFKEISGISVYQFIQKIRLTVLKEMVEEGCPLSTATSRCGFQDYSNFFKLFKKEYGCSPKEYFRK